jgi:hypothetical protein
MDFSIGSARGRTRALKARPGGPFPFGRWAAAPALGCIDLDKRTRRAARLLIKVALSNRARNLPMNAADAAVFFKLAALRAAEGDEPAMRVSLWSCGKPLWVLAHRERCSERTILNKIDATLDSMRLGSRHVLDEPAESIEALN